MTKKNYRPKKRDHKHARETSRVRMSSSSNKPKAEDRSERLAEPEAKTPSAIDPQCQANGRHRPQCACTGDARQPIQ